MMRLILLVAAREFRQIAATRSFWVTLLIVPIALAFGPITSRLTQRPDTRTLMLIDPANREAPAIRARLALEDQRDVLVALSRYSDRHKLDSAAHGALWTQHDRWYGDAEVAAFQAQGGAPAALARIGRAIPPSTPPFVAPEPGFRIVPTPSALAGVPPEKLGDRLQSWLDPPRGSATQKLDYAIYVPPTFGTPGATVRLWSSREPGEKLMQPLQAVLTHDLRVAFLEHAGVAPVAASTATTLQAPIFIDTPKAGEGQEKVIVRSIFPLLIAYVLLMSLLLSGSWMLQGLIEERSNKLLETVLACVSPDELLYGKLIGTVAIGLTMVLLWSICAVIAAFATQGIIADFLRPALAPISSLGVILAMIYFFVAGYLMLSMIFIAIGAMSDSMRDAQSYLSPVILVIAMPFALIAQTILRDPDATLVRVMTWIPFYTPFTMLARLGVGVPTWEAFGSGLLLAAFVAVELVLLGRVFRASLLASGDRPGLKAIAGMMRGRQRG